VKEQRVLTRANDRWCHYSSKRYVTAMGPNTIRW